MTHEPRHGLPERILPVFICSMAEPWIGESAIMECRKQMSSAQVPRCGKRSLMYLPHWPYCLNCHFGPTTRPWFLCPPRPKVFTSIVLPSLLPAVLSGAGLSFSRCIGEFGSVVTIGGQVPGKTEVSSQWIRALIENDDRTGAAAISIVLLSISFTVLILLRIVGGRAARREEKAA